MMDTLYDLDGLLRHRASQPAEGGQVLIREAWVDRVPTVPVDHGAQAVVSFAERCWKANLTLQRQKIEARRALQQASIALNSLIERGLDRDVALASAGVERALELLN
jgi:hypothetical protein